MMPDDWTREKVIWAIQNSTLDLDSVIELNEKAENGFPLNEFIELWTIYREEGKRVN